MQYRICRIHIFNGDSYTFGWLVDMINNLYVDSKIKTIQNRYLQIKTNV